METNRVKSSVITVLLGGVLLCAASVCGDIWYVDADALPGGNGESWGSAFGDIETAIEHADPAWIECMGPHDDIWVKSGLYSLTNQIDVNRVVRIYGGFPNDMLYPTWEDRDWRNNKTVVNGNDSVSCFYVCNYCVIDGLTIREGYIYLYHGGGGMCIDARPVDCTDSLMGYMSPIIRNCDFVDNRTRGGHPGGGIHIIESNPTIENCTFSYNRSGSGGGAIYFFRSEPRILRCAFYKNSAAGNYGGAIGMGNLTNSTSSLTVITNCLFHDNDAGSGKGGGIGTLGCFPSITNCTFSGNTANVKGGAFWSWDSDEPRIRNCIFWGNSPDQLFITTTEPDLEIHYNNIQGGWTGAGSRNINVDPGFAGLGDFHLAAGSLCIDAGSNAYDVVKDLDGLPRPHDGDLDGTATCDMGCYEFGFMDLTITSIVTIPEVPSPGEIVSVEVTVINQGSDGVGPFQIDWYADSVFPPLPQISGTESEIVYSLGAGNSHTMVKNHKYNMSGGYSMYAQVDTMKQVSETDESNNVFGSQIIMVAQNANVNITIKLPLSEDLDPYSSIPLTVRFFTPDSDVLSDTPLADYNLTAVLTGDTATVNINDLAEGNYDVTVSSEHTLINVKRNVAVSLPSTSVNMGTLLEGNANNDFGIDCGDLSLLADSWLLTEEARGFNQMADFDRNRLIDNNDFALLAGNWWKTSPVEIP